MLNSTILIKLKNKDKELSNGPVPIDVFGNMKFRFYHNDDICIMKVGPFDEAKYCFKKGDIVQIELKI